MYGLIGLLVRVARDEDGATAIEYALLAMLLAMAIIGSVFLIGGKVSGQFERVVAEGFPEGD